MVIKKNKKINERHPKYHSNGSPVQGRTKDDGWTNERTEEPLTERKKGKIILGGRGGKRGGRIPSNKNRNGANKRKWGGARILSDKE